MSNRTPSTTRHTHSTTRSILRATGIFGGVRVLTILCSLIRNKLIAMFIGPTGVGLITLYNSVSDIVTTLSRLNIDQSAVRDISRSSADNVGSISAVVMRAGWILGLLGALALCLCSPLLSEWSFGTTSLWWTFCVLALIPLGNTLYCSVSAIFQGTRQFGALAGMGIWSTLAGIVICVPLIIFFGQKSIIWVLATYGIACGMAALLYHRKSPKIQLPWREIWHTSRSFIKLGALITAGTLATQLFNYLFVLFLNSYSNTDTLGVYQAGFTLVNAYVGVFFTGMWVEFLPRLSATVHSQKRTTVAVSHQITTTVWLLMPIIGAFVCADELIIKILYTDTFMTMLPFITLGIAGVLLRAVSWCIAHVMLAKGDGAVYVVTEAVSGAVFLVLHIVFFSTLGFLGLGIAYIIWYAAYLAMVYIIYKYRYKMTIHREAWKILAVATIFVAACVTAKWFVGWWLTLAITATAVPFSLRHLRK